MTKDMTFPVGDAKAGIRALSRYRETKAARSAFELLITAVPFAVLWALMWAALGIGYWLSLLLAVPTELDVTRI